MARNMKHFLIASGAIASSFMAFGLVNSSTASAAGACGGGNTVKAVVQGWTNHGVMDDVVKPTHNKVRLDGSASDLVRKHLVKVTVARTTRVQNFTCKGGRFVPVGMTTYRKGEVIWAYASDTADGIVKMSYATTCGNLRTGRIPVRVPKRPKPKPRVVPTPQPTPTPASSCVNGQVNPANSGAACQGNQSSQTASVDTTQTARQDCEAKGGTWNNSSVCTIVNNNTTVINQTTVQVNANCSMVTMTMADGTVKVVYKENNGNVVNICSTQTTTTPPVNPPPSAKSIKIVASTTLNDIPSGKSSGPFTIKVNASDPNGSLTIDPGIGAVSRCDSNVPTAEVTFSSLPAGNSDHCVIFYAPSDPLRPTSMTVTMTASLGNASDIKSQTFAITYPTRPE